MAAGTGGFAIALFGLIGDSFFLILLEF